jgi:septum formation protein
VSERDRLVLASASPARLSTLRAAGIDPVVVVSGVDESGVDDGDAATVANRLATLKAQAVAQRVSERFVLGCDSVLAFDGTVLGKPGSPEEARARWRAMRGRGGTLHTGHCLIDRSTGRQLVRSAATLVEFADVSDTEIEAYVESGEPMQVAGAFTIDGLGGAFVTRIEGDHHNVIGLSLPMVREMFASLGVVWTDLWSFADTAD